MSVQGDVIAAIATAQGRSGVGVVRVSGPDLASVAAGILGRIPKPRSATRASFLDADGRAIDDGIAIYFPRPASYTGEDVIELQGHGGPVVLQLVLRRCLQLGARLAEPGEFTRRAYLNDKLDLAQAEAVADLIDAATERAARCALRSLKGEFSRVVNTLAEQLVELRALVEATLDFPDEEIDALDRENVRERLRRLSDAVSDALGQGRRGSVLRSGLQVVLAGAPNVGKSSLLNRLAGEERAIVTEIPGTTRDTVRQTIHIEGVPLNIVDTAGLRETDDRIEVIGIERAWGAINNADVLLLTVDAATGVTDGDREIMARLPERLARIVVFNKIDLVGLEPRKVQSEGETDVWLSALTGAGVDLLCQALLEQAGWQDGGEDVFMARERHLLALEDTAAALARAGALLERGELLAEELRTAQTALGSIVGEFSADDLLGEIFSRFCIGK